MIFRSRTLDGSILDLIEELIITAPMELQPAHSTNTSHVLVDSQAGRGSVFLLYI